MTIRFSPDEAWDALSQARTGILATLRRDGVPISLPVWFAVLDRTVCLVVPSRTKKVARIRYDPRASFLVESGERWAELRAVHLTGVIEFVEDPELQATIDEQIERKYAAYRTPRTDMPSTAQAHYAERTFLRLVPDDRILSWDNSRLALSRR